MDVGKAGGVVNAEIAIAGAKGLVRRKDSLLLAENGGHKGLGPSFTCLDGIFLTLCESRHSSI